MKKVLTIIVAMILVLGLATSAYAATDSAIQAATSLYDLGLFKGVGTNADGTPNFDLDRTPTRSEAVTMLVRLLGKDLEAKSGNWSTPFIDVADWAKPYVGYAYANGLTMGTGSTTFGGNSPVTAAQYLTFVLRALGYESGTDFSWDTAWTLSDSLGFTNKEYHAGTTQFLRGDVAIISYSALSVNLKGSETSLLDDLYVNNAITGPASMMQVHFVDVGQGDSILIESAGEFMLIDAGGNEDGVLVVNYLKSQGVTDLEYVIGTHPHEDHIGGLDTVIEYFDTEIVILPEKEHTTQTFEDLLDAVAAEGLSLTIPRVGQTYMLGDASFTILSPNDDYGDDLNNWSVGIKLVNGSTSFVMCGDADSTAETDILANGIDIKADVLKLGHHGSNTATASAFLTAVDTTYAVISCGAGNTYGHPHIETLIKLNNAGIGLFRTDLQGTVIATSDGTSIVWNITPVADTLANPGQAYSEPAPAPQTPSGGDTKFILNTNTQKFHYPDCRYVGSIAPGKLSRNNFISGGINCSWVQSLRGM